MSHSVAPSVTHSASTFPRRRLRDAEGEDAGLIGVRHPRHRSDERVAVGRVGDRAVDDLGQPRLAQHRHAGHGVGDVGLQPVEVVWVKLEAEVLRQGVVGRRPMRAGVTLVGAEVEAVLFLPQVVGHVHVAQERQLVARASDQARTSGTSSKTRYWWLITAIGTVRPPKGRNHSPTRWA
jgi:hypothetical protein